MGVADYIARDDACSVFIEENALKDQRLPDLRKWGGDGIIADFDDPAIAQAVTSSGLAAVGFGGGYGWYQPGSAIPYFYTNNRLIAAEAADHLLERGFMHVAYCGYPRSPVNGWSEEREQAFVDHVRERSLDVAVFRCTDRVSRDWGAMQAALTEWLRELPKPVGIMTANDSRGREVLEACRAEGIAVPRDVAVIGVDNDELLCQLSSPRLSSVEQGARALGHAAAEMLSRLIDGETPSDLHIIIDPIGVVPRLSTDVLAVDDPTVAKAMSFLQEHASDVISVADVVRTVAVSRSTLEARFRESLHCTVREAIRRAHLERARRLVTDTTLPLKQVAAQSGFKSVQHMTTSFNRAFGRTPAKYRSGLK